MTNGEKFKETFPDVEVRETVKGFVILKLKAKYPGKNCAIEYSDSLTIWNSIWNAEYSEKPEEDFDARLKQYLVENDLRIIPNSEWEDLNSKWKECLGDIRDIKTRINALEPSSSKPRPEPIKGYICDPKKNKECAKTACYERGGLCCLTLNPKYAKEPSEEKETELDVYSHPGVMSHRHKEIETCVRVPKEEHTEMHRRK